MPSVSVQHLSNGDWIALAGVVAVVVTMLLNELRNLLGDRGKRSATDAVVEVRIEGLDDRLKGIENEQRALRQQYAEHEKECAEFRGEISGDIRRHADAQEKAGRDLEYVKRQVQSLGPRADTFTQILPPPNT